MNFELKTITLAQAAHYSVDLLVLLVGEDFQPGCDPLSSLIAQALKHKDWQAQPAKVLELYQVPAITARRVVLAGVGNGSAQAVYQAVQACASALKSAAVQQAALCFALAPTDVRAIGAAVQAAAHTVYTYSTTKTQKSAAGSAGATGVALHNITLGIPTQEVDSATHHTFVNAVAIASGVELAREWANRPANHATPRHLADAAQELAERYQHIQCQIFGPQEVEKLGMGAFLSVARASHEPLRFIELRYNGANATQAPIVLVGKGITFDTGGISLKPAAEMDEMKFDMSGAASVLGVFRALAQLQPEVNVMGLIPACENMPGGSATKPGDVVTSLDGQTIEILNTDAEGRLVLCDALTYAARFKPAALIDIATLTGACVIALGSVRSGLFSNNDALATALQSAGESVQDLCWRMPLDDDYAEGLKTNFADVANVAGRAAGSVTAAKFLQRFVGDTPWAHLDIAGTAWKSGTAKGGTGRPVALLVQYVLQHSDTNDNNDNNDTSDTSDTSVIATKQVAPIEAQEVAQADEHVNQSNQPNRVKKGKAKTKDRAKNKAKRSVQTPTN